MNLSTPFYIDKRQGKNSIDLCGEWEFAFEAIQPKTVTAVRYPYKAKIPAATYWNVYEAGLLPHPYEGTNSKQYRNLDMNVWYYRKRFTLDRVTNAETENAYLVFDGVGYYTKVWLNGELLGEHEGMFGGPVCDVADKLICGENELVVELKAYNYGLSAEKRYWGGGNGGWCNDCSAIIPWNIAKDASTSNGDFNTFGIWRPVRIETVPKKHMARPYLYTKSIDGSDAVLGLELNIATEKIRELEVSMGNSQAECSYDYTFAYRDGLSGILSDEKVGIKVIISDGEKTVFEEYEDFELYDYEKSGFTLKGQDLQIYRRDIKLSDVDLWYPNGLGNAKLYDVKIEMTFEGVLLDTLRFKTGIRTIELHESAGRKYRQRWDKYHFAVNGKKIFLKGMNWMPIDFLYKASSHDYRWTLEQVKNAGIQLLRVWSGGGMPEEDCFYEICDELGIMVWQDSFLANHNSPLWNNEILENQVCYYLYRIRNHPSLAVHCAGNEHRAYHTDNNASQYIIQRNIEDLDFTRKFYRASPDRGSMHSYRDWEPVWYRKMYGDLPFMAECGIHCFPNAKSLRRLINKKEYSMPLDRIMEESFRDEFPELLNHFTEYQPDRIPRMLSRATHINSINGINLEDLCEATQMAAHEFYQLMCQSLREAYPHCVGLMPWVFKRSWTTVAIQLVDGLGETVAPYYAVKNSYSAVLCFAQMRELDYAPGEQLSIPVSVINDGTDTVTGNVVVDIFSPELKKVYSQSYIADISDGTYLTEVACESFVIPETWCDKYFFVRTSLRDGSRLVSSCLYPLACLSVMRNAEFREEFRSKPCPNLAFDKGPFQKKQLESTKKAVIRAELLKNVRCGERIHTRLRLTCTGAPAYPVKLQVYDDKTVSYFSDNYFFMDDKETAEITAVTRNIGDTERTLTLEISAWNADKITVEI